MKLKNIISTFCATAALIGLAGCTDTDAQYDQIPMATPELRLVSPSADSDLIFGERVFEVTFQENIGFASNNTSQITLDGKPVKKALVLGASKTLTIYADVDFSTSHTLHIPAGLVVTADKKAYNETIDRTWTFTMPENNATAMTKKLGWGWNLGNHFDTSDVTWGYWDKATPTANLYKNLKAAGVSTVRIPATWTCHMTDNVIDKDYLNEVAKNVDWALGAGLNVILNTHHDSFETKLADATNDPEYGKQVEATIDAIWSQVSAKFKGRSENLIYETFNEIHSGDDWGTGSAEQFETLNKWNSIALKAIRANEKNVAHWVGVPGFAANIGLTQANLKLPEDEKSKVMVAIHSYDPYNYCLGDGVTWGHKSYDNLSCSDEQYIMELMYSVYQSYIKNDIPVYLGEYGCSKKEGDDDKYRAYYLNFFTRAASYFGIPTCIWDNNSVGGGTEHHGYFNHEDGSYLNDSEALVKSLISGAAAGTDPAGLQSLYDSAE